MNRTCIAALMVAVACLPATVRADCVDGVRKATPREIDFFNRVHGELRAALPAPLPDWTADPVPDRTYGSTCQGTPEGDVWVDVRTTYTYRMPKEQAERNNAEIRKLAAEVEGLEKMPPEVAKERQGWMDKYSEATRAARQAEKDGNRDLAKQKYAERDGYDQQAAAVRARYNESIKPRIAPLRARIAELDTAPKAVRVQAVVNNSAQLGPQNVTDIVVGTIPASGKKPLFKVVSVQVQLEGPAAQREALAASFDKAKLQQLLH